MAVGYDFDFKNLDQGTVKSVIRDLANTQYADKYELANAQSLINQLSRVADAPRFNASDPTFHANFNQAISILSSKGSSNIQKTIDPSTGNPQNTYTGQPTITTGPGGGGVGSGTVPSSVTQAGPTLDDLVSKDKSLIEAEGQRQFGQTNDFIDQDTLNREAARQKLAKALTQQAQDSFQYALPQTLEDLNSRHLLNGSGLEQELGRKQEQIAKDITNQVGVLGAGDIDSQSKLRADALTGRQGFQTAGLNRGFSLQDFQRQADLSKQIGAMSSPQVGGGKGAVGSTLSGIGAIAPYAGFAATGNPMWMGAKAAQPSGGGGK